MLFLEPTPQKKEREAQENKKMYSIRGSLAQVATAVLEEQERHRTEALPIEISHELDSIHRCHHHPTLRINLDELSESQRDLYLIKLMESLKECRRQSSYCDDFSSHDFSSSNSTSTTTTNKVVTLHVPTSRATTNQMIKIADLCNECLPNLTTLVFEEEQRSLCHVNTFFAHLDPVRSNRIRSVMLFLQHRYAQRDVDARWDGVRNYFARSSSIRKVYLCTRSAAALLPLTTAILDGFDENDRTTLPRFVTLERSDIPNLERNGYAMRGVGGRGPTNITNVPTMTPHMAKSVMASTANRSLVRMEALHPRLQGGGGDDDDGGGGGVSFSLNFCASHRRMEMEERKALAILRFLLVRNNLLHENLLFCQHHNDDDGNNHKSYRIRDPLALWPHLLASLSQFDWSQPDDDNNNDNNNNNNNNAMKTHDGVKSSHEEDIVKDTDLCLSLVYLMLREQIDCCLFATAA